MESPSRKRDKLQYFTFALTCVKCFVANQVRSCVVQDLSRDGLRGPIALTGRWANRLAPGSPPACMCQAHLGYEEIEPDMRLRRLQLPSQALDETQAGQQAQRWGSPRRRILLAALPALGGAGLVAFYPSLGVSVTVGLGILATVNSALTGSPSRDKCDDDRTRE